MTMSFTELHKPIIGADELLSVLSQLNADMHNAGLYFQWDKADEIGFTSYPDLPEHCIMILASFDVTYYHQLELCFHQIRAHTLIDNNQWPDHWNKNQLELLQGVERSHVLMNCAVPEDETIHVFAFNVGSFSDRQLYIIAEGFSFVSGTVFHYNRLAQQNLDPGERIAWWVTR